MAFLPFTYFVLLIGRCYRRRLWHSRLCTSACYGFGLLVQGTIQFEHKNTVRSRVFCYQHCLCPAMSRLLPINWWIFLPAPVRHTCWWMWEWSHFAAFRIFTSAVVMHTRFFWPLDDPACTPLGRVDVAIVLAHRLCPHQFDPRIFLVVSLQLSVSTRLLDRSLTNLGSIPATGMIGLHNFVLNGYRGLYPALNHPLCEADHTPFPV